MTQPTSVTVEGMRAATRSFEVAQAAAQKDRNTVSEEKESLRSSWTGDAANTFQLAGDAWLSHMDAIIGGLVSLENAMSSGGANYDNTHQVTQDMTQSARQLVESAAPPPGLQF